MGSGASKSQPVPQGISTQSQTLLSPGAIQQNIQALNYLETRVRAGGKGVIALRNNAARVAAKNMYLGLARVLKVITVTPQNKQSLGLNIMVLQMMFGGDGSMDGMADNGLSLNDSTNALGGSSPHQNVQTIDISPDDLADDAVKTLLASEMQGVSSDDWSRVYLVNMYTPGYKALNFALLEFLRENIRIVSGGLTDNIVTETDSSGYPKPILQVSIADLGQETQRLACEATRSIVSRGAGLCTSCSTSGVTPDAESEDALSEEDFSTQLQTAAKNTADPTASPMTTFKLSCPAVTLSGPIIAESDIHCRSIGILVKRAQSEGGDASYYVIAEDLSYYAMAALLKIATDYSSKLTWASSQVSMVPPNLLQTPAVYAAANPEFMSLIKGWNLEEQLLTNATFNCEGISQGDAISFGQTLIQKGFQTRVITGVSVASRSQAATLSESSAEVQSERLEQGL